MGLVYLPTLIPCDSKNNAIPKMDGENNGSKPYEQMDDLGGFPPIFGNIQINYSWIGKYISPMDPSWGNKPDQNSIRKQDILVVLKVCMN